YGREPHRVIVAILRERAAKGAIDVGGRARFFRAWSVFVGGNQPRAERVERGKFCRGEILSLRFERRVQKDPAYFWKDSSCVWNASPKQQHAAQLRQRDNRRPSEPRPFQPLAPRNLFSHGRIFRAQISTGSQNLRTNVLRSSISSKFSSALRLQQERHHERQRSSTAC